MVQLLSYQKSTNGENLEKKISKPIELTSGVPQGSILSTIIFTIHWADLEEWVNHSKLLNYKHKPQRTRPRYGDRKLGRRCNRNTTIYGSDGLLLHPTKTEFMLLNTKKHSTLKQIMVGAAKSWK